MTERTMIDFADLTDGGRISNLSGRNRGLAARAKYHLDWTAPADAEELTIRVPENLDSITPSFIQGMFGRALAVLNSDEAAFFSKFHFEAPAFILEQIRGGVLALRTSRDLRDLQ